MINDIKQFGFKEFLISIFFYNNLAVKLKGLLICNRKGHDQDGYGYCLKCWVELPQEADKH
jgi:hypothetical protein